MNIGDIVVIKGLWGGNVIGIILNNMGMIKSFYRFDFKNGGKMFVKFFSLSSIKNSYESIEIINKEDLDGIIDNWLIDNWLIENIL